MNENRFWKFLNSPLVVLIIGLIVLPVALTASQVYSAKLKTRIMTSEIRSWIDGIKNSKDQGAIKQIVSNAVGQVAEGIKAGFKQSSRGQDRQLSEFVALRRKIDISGTKPAANPWPTQEKIIGLIRNKSDKSIRNVHLNVLFYNSKGDLIDVKDEWLSNLKVLDPNQAYGFEVTRSLGNHNDDPKLVLQRKSSKVKVQVVSFDVYSPS